MFFRNLSFIRELPNNQRLTNLVETICGSGAADRAVIIDQLQRSLIALKRKALHISTDVEHPDLLIEEEIEPGKVIISRIADGAVFKRINGDWYNAFDFLSDYLGLDREIPISIDQLDARYGKLLDAETVEDYDDIADIVAMVLRKEIYGIDEANFIDVPPRTSENDLPQFIDEIK